MIKQKKRFEISDERIRALYGHSFSMHIKKEKARLPQILFHGTARRFLVEIKKTGLLPMNRQYVHLSADIDTAMRVGNRHDSEPVILRVDAIASWNDGVAFFFAVIRYG